jgi:hypothetical protein
VKNAEENNPPDWVCVYDLTHYNPWRVVHRSQQKTGQGMRFKQLERDVAMVFMARLNAQKVPLNWPT